MKHNNNITICLYIVIFNIKVQKADIRANKTYTMNSLLWVIEHWSKTYKLKYMF